MHSQRSDRPRRRRLLRSVALVVLAGTLALADTATPAFAGDRPPVDATALREVPQATGWGVTDWDRTAAHNFENYVWDFAQIGNRMFVAGSFLSVQKGRSGRPRSQPYLAAFDVDTGAWIPQFAPRLDGAVFALAVTPDGSLLAGGQFRSVNGNAKRSGLVALRPRTGAIDARFGAFLRRPGSTEPAVVRDLEVIDGQVYVGGNFARVSWARGARRYAVGGLVRLDASSGVPDRSWRPRVEGGAVYGFAIDQARGRMHLGGISLDEIDDTPVTRFGTIDLAAGALVPGLAPYRWNDTTALDIWDVAYAGDKIFVAGTEHMLQVLDADDRRRLGFHTAGVRGQQFRSDRYFSGGDFQVVEPVGAWVVAGCHCTFEVREGRRTWFDAFAGRRRPIRMAGLVHARSGRVARWSPDLSGSRDGVWAVGSDDRGCLWLGGQFDGAGRDSGASFWVGNFARFCPPGVGGSGLTAPTPPTNLELSQVGADVHLRWDPSTDDIGVVGYIVRRDGIEIARPTTTSWVDPAPAPRAEPYRYNVQAYDAAGYASGNGTSNTRSILVS
jgi:trimeric autotransporter adhesin